MAGTTGKADEPAAAPILAVVEDMIFLSKILETAGKVGVAVEPVDPAKVVERVKQLPAQALILDLNHRSGLAVGLLRSLKAGPATKHIPVLGFLSHVQADLAEAVRAAGCDQVMARSAFSAQLPQLLEKLAGR